MERIWKTRYISSNPFPLLSQQPLKVHWDMNPSWANLLVKLVLSWPNYLSIEPPSLQYMSLWGQRWDISYWNHNNSILKDSPFPFVCPHTVADHKCVDFFQALYFSYLVYMSACLVALPTECYYDYYKFCSRFWDQVMWFPESYLFSTRLIWLFRVFLSFTQISGNFFVCFCEKGLEFWQGFHLSYRLFEVLWIF